MDAEQIKAAFATLKTAVPAMGEEEALMRPVVDAALTISETIVLDIHRIADALENSYALQYQTLGITREEVETITALRNGTAYVMPVANPIP